MAEKSRGLFASLLKPDPHEREAKEALTQVRKDIDELRRLRMINDMALRGDDKSCRYTPAELRQRLTMFRDQSMNLRFRDEYLDLMGVLYRRDPTAEEIHIGIPSGAGLAGISLNGIAAEVAGLAWTLHGVTQYLSELERMARGGDAKPSKTMKVLKGGAVLGAVALVGIGSWVGYRKVQDWREGRRELKKAKYIGELEEVEDNLSALKAKMTEAVEDLEEAQETVEEEIDEALEEAAESEDQGEEE